MSKKDPLEGKREAIGAGESNTTTWLDDGTGAPVKVGDLFQLRSFGIEITRVQHKKSGMDFHYVVDFKRMYPDRVHHAGIKATSGIELDEDQRKANRTRPPEPEQVAPHEVRHLPTSVAARARFDQTRHAVEQERRCQQLAGRIRNLEKQAQRSGVDLDEEITLFEMEVARVERLVGKAA